GAGKGAESGPFAVSPHEVNIEVAKLDPEIDRIVLPNPKLYKVASGFAFIEGPVWTRQGTLLFSDPNENTIYYRQPGSNGLGLDPEGRLVLCEHGDRDHAVWMAFDVLEDGTLGGGRVFFDATEWARSGKKGVPDGLDVDRDGNLFAAGPGGIHVIAPDGTHLGSFEIDLPTANSAWGEDVAEGGSYLYIAADTAIYRIRLNTKGQAGLP
ncbi:MAG TPA: SMP-30/gluconolactonase/LRE family protein, partial [Vicinamibacteria bacterium]|nr:SMP-30/gluconolactonase/LRE family protein [Vicinamibacteria bacterium]